MKALVVALFLLITATQGHGQSRFANFPFAKHSTSPDGRFTLANRNCTNSDCREMDRKLWLIDNDTGSRKVLMEIERNVRIGWAPSGNAFFLNDNLGSNIAESYLYFPAEDRRVDIIDWINAKIPADQRFEIDSHHYLNALYWVDGTSIIVKQSGHFDKEGAEGFTICYRVNVSGQVERLSQSHQEAARCGVGRP